MTSKQAKRVGIVKSIRDFNRKFGKAVTAFVAVASFAYTLGYKTANLVKEREIMTMENKHAMELLQLKEDYMEKYFQLRERLVHINENDTINENKGL